MEESFANGGPAKCPQHLCLYDSLVFRQGVPNYGKTSVVSKSQIKIAVLNKK